MSSPFVSFGIVNCNRLHYLKSCFESLIRTTASYENKEIIVVDNASIESGTKEYLDSIEKIKNVKVIRREKRDPSNEFAKALNLISKEAKGDFICPLQGDMQFVANNWLEDYIEIYQKAVDSAGNKITGCIALDAQRNVTNERERSGMSYPIPTKTNSFVANTLRPPISGCGDVFYPREIIEMIFPWNETNLNHEGTNDSETAMLNKVKKILSGKSREFYMFSPVIPVSVGIYTDKRGTQGRVRKNKRYGDYWAAKDETVSLYYNIFDLNFLNLRFSNRDLPVGIEEIASPIGWDPPIINGSWLKNPIRPESATESDFVVLYEEAEKEEKFSDNYIDGWLNT